MSLMYAPVQTPYPHRSATRPAHWAPPQPALAEVLDQLEPIPAYCLILGFCKDKRPLLFDLTDPAAGALLIAGDDPKANASLLEGTLSAATSTHTAKELNLHLISPTASIRDALVSPPLFPNAFRPDGPEAEILLEEMVNLVRLRHETGEQLPFHILAVDQLNRLLDGLSPQGAALLNWLIEYGPEVGVWLLATIESARVKKHYFPTLEAFPSRMVGRVKFPRLARFFSGVGRVDLEDLLDEGQYLARSGREGLVIQPLAG